VINVGTDATEMMSSSQSQGGDVSHAPLTEPAPSTDDDLVQGSPDSTVTPGSDEHVDCIEAETAAALHLDECDAVVAEDVPTLSEVVAELEMNVKHPHQRQVPVAEPAQIPSVSYNKVYQFLCVHVGVCMSYRIILYDDFFWAPYLKSAPSHSGSGSLANAWFLGPPHESTSQTRSRLVQPFLQGLPV